MRTTRALLVGGQQTLAHNRALFFVATMTTHFCLLLKSLIFSSRTRLNSLKPQVHLLRLSASTHTRDKDLSCANGSARTRIRDKDLTHAVAAAKRGLRA